MTGYFNLSEEELQKLPKEIKNIEDNLYDLAYPLITNMELPHDIKYLYETLNIPIIKPEDYKDFEKDEKFSQKIKGFSEYLQLNIEIEMLEEGKIGHTLRVARYAHELCNLEQIDPKETKKIYIAALFHDVGKIEIPKKITSKPGKLTDKEFEIMKKHCEHGYEILLGYLDEETLEMILSHHERVNKSGYPRGIVPSMGAKIIGIADSYDAMLSQRVYKKNKSLKATLEELVNCTIETKDGGKGILYDETLVKKFVKFHGYDILKQKFLKEN